MVTINKIMWKGDKQKMRREMKIFKRLKKNFWAQKKEQYYQVVCAVLDTIKVLELEECEESFEFAKEIDRKMAPWGPEEKIYMRELL